MYRIFKTVLTVVLLCYVAVTLFYLFFPVFITKGVSMYPTLKDGDFLLSRRIANAYSTGDVVIATQRNENGDYARVVKRIIGCPGDEVTVSDNHLFINDEYIIEEYLPADCYTSDFSVTVPEGRYFVLGDNREQSYDSRYTEMIKEDDLIAEVIFDLSAGDGF